MPKISEPIYVAAHQLKSPITIIKEYVQILYSEDLGSLNKKQKEYLEDVLKNIEQMQRITSGLLDASLVESRVYKLNIQPVDLVKTTMDIIDKFSILAKSFNCNIIFSKPDNIPLVSTDPQKIREVIENFVSNAIKYRPAGHRNVEIKLQKKKDKVLFSCSDDGIGISPKDAKKIFSKFFRTEEAVKIDPTGTGLGLYINKAIIELSGGKIWFKNNKNKGITFYFILPII